MDLNPASFLSSIDVKALFGTIFNFVAMIIIALLVGGMVFMYFRRKKTKKSGVHKDIRWWEEISGQLIPIRVDKAIEIIIPGTNLRVFYVKDKNMWLPRFTRGVTANTFFVALTKNKEIVNFTLKTIDECKSKADLSFDHTDMRWASENLREFVKRNYKDKATTWWKEYSGIIGVAIFIIIMTISLVTIIYFMRGIVTDIGGVASTLTHAMENINSCAPTSGVIEANG